MDSVPPQGPPVALDLFSEKALDALIICYAWPTCWPLSRNELETIVLLVAGSGDEALLHHVLDAVCAATHARDKRRHGLESTVALGLDAGEVYRRRVRAVLRPLGSFAGVTEAEWRRTRIGFAESATMRLLQPSKLDGRTTWTAETTLAACVGVYDIASQPFPGTVDDSFCKLQLVTCVARPLSASCLPKAQTGWFPELPETRVDSAPAADERHGGLFGVAVAALLASVAVVSVAYLRVCSKALN